MRRTITKFASIAAVSMFALTLAQPAQAVQNTGAGTTAASAYFEFTDGTDTFVFKLTDSAKIQQARNILSGVETETVGVMGKVVKTPAFYNTPWKYQLAPNSVSFFGMAVEVCDAADLVRQQPPERGRRRAAARLDLVPVAVKLTREITAP